MIHSFTTHDETKWMVGLHAGSWSQTRPRHEGHLDVFWYDEESAETFGNNTLIE